MKTKEEIEHLKQNWMGDPCWDIEETEGFEEHREELLAFRLEKEREWKALEEKELGEMAAAAGMPGNLLFANCIRSLAVRIEALETELELLRNRGGI